MDLQFQWDLDIKHKPNHTMTNHISVCVKHGFVVNKTHTSIKKTAHKNVTCKHYSHRIQYQCILLHVFLGPILLSTCFVKSFKKYPQNAHWTRLVNVLVAFLFDMQISLILKMLRNRRVKTLACSLKWVVMLFGKW